MRNLWAMIAGALFGLGLWIGGMTDTARVQAWLDVLGAWDPTLGFVMVGAILPMAIAWPMTKGRRPRMGGNFPSPVEPVLDRRLIGGSALFGFGWALVGLCPGPAMASLAFGAQVDFDGVKTEGIDRVSLEDITHASEMGYRIKLLGVARMQEHGLEQRMQPCLVPASSPIGALDGVTNMVVCEGDFVGQTVFEGPGAGEGPTASAIVADMVDIARGSKTPAFGVPAADLKAAPRAASLTPAAYYLRLALADQPGVLAEVAAALGSSGVPIETMRQNANGGPGATVLIVTHETTRDALDAALATFEASDNCLAPPVSLRIESV